MKMEQTSPPTAVGSNAGLGPWQPIETAPKDGTEVLLYVPGESLFPTAARYDTKEHFEADYGDPNYMQEGWRWSFGYPSDFHEQTVFPTHWMPLPDPPPHVPLSDVDGA